MNSTQGCVLDISLREALPDARIFGAGDIRTSSCCSDSRKCRPGDVFVAVLGAFQDGHDFVDDAIERGATAILAERYLPVNVPVCVVPDSRVALGRL